MKTIVIASRKGGSGKSTLAAHLSVLAQEGGGVRLIDTDPQGSLRLWRAQREGETPEIVYCSAGKLGPVIDRARKDGLAYVIVDTPPYADASITDAIRVADFVLVPVYPALFDLGAVQATLEFARAQRKKLLAVLNRAPISTSWGGVPALVRQARAVIEGLGAQVAETVITQRAPIYHALTHGKTVGEYESAGVAALEIAALWAEIKTKLES